MYSPASLVSERFLKASGFRVFCGRPASSFGDHSDERGFLHFKMGIENLPGQVGYSEASGGYRNSRAGSFVCAAAMFAMAKLRSTCATQKRSPARTLRIALGFVIVLSLHL
jgi:hypothetical protein